MQLREIGPGDLSLYERIHCDPATMEHLGGPLPREGIEDKLREDAASNATGEAWVLAITLEDRTPAGTVSIWEHEWRGQRIAEIGWMVLPPFQGRGLGSEAVRAVLDMARSEERWGVVEAFPPIANGASNAMCRKMGFWKVEECDYEFRGRPLRCNRWRLDLR